MFEKLKENPILFEIYSFLESSLKIRSNLTCIMPKPDCDDTIYTFLKNKFLKIVFICFINFTFSYRL